MDLGGRLLGLLIAGSVLQGLAGCGRSPATGTHPVFVDLEVLARRHPGWPLESAIDREVYRVPVAGPLRPPKLPALLVPAGPSATLAPPSAAVAGMAGGSRYERTRALLSSRDDRKIRDIRSVAEAGYRAGLNRHAAETAIRLEQSVSQARTDAAAEITRLRLLVLSSEQQSRSLAGGPPADVLAKLDKARLDLAKAEADLRATVAKLREEHEAQEQAYAVAQRRECDASIDSQAKAVRADTARVLAELAAAATHRAEELPGLEEPSAERAIAQLKSSRQARMADTNRPPAAVRSHGDYRRLEAYAEDLRAAIRAEVRMRVDRMAHERRMQVTYVRRSGVPDETITIGRALSLELGQ